MLGLKHVRACMWTCIVAVVRAVVTSLQARQACLVSLDLTHTHTHTHTPSLSIFVCLLRFAAAPSAGEYATSA